MFHVGFKIGTRDVIGRAADGAAAAQGDRSRR